MRQISGSNIGHLGGATGKLKMCRSGRTMIVSIPIELKRKVGRKQVVTPAGSASWQPAARVDTTIVKATLVRAHRGRNMLESGKYDSVRKLAKAEKINESYLGRMVRLTLLSPALTEAFWMVGILRRLALNSCSRACRLFGKNRVFHSTLQGADPA